MPADAQINAAIIARMSPIVFLAGLQVPGLRASSSLSCQRHHSWPAREEIHIITAPHTTSRLVEWTTMERTHPRHDHVSLPNIAKKYFITIFACPLVGYDLFMNKELERE